MSAKDRIIRQVDKLFSGEISTSDFCAFFEETIKFDLAPGDFPGDEVEILEELFDVVALFSPRYRSDRTLTGFKNEEQVRRAVLNACTRLGWWDGD